MFQSLSITSNMKFLSLCKEFSIYCKPSSNLVITSTISFFSPLIELEYCEKGSFFDLIQLAESEYNKGKWDSINEEILPLALVQKMLFQTCEALLFLKQHGVVHSDVKPHNILIKNGDNIALSDFGMSVDTQGTCSQQLLGMTLTYLAPEHFESKSTDVYCSNVKKDFKPTFYSDLYALGVTFSKALCLLNMNENVVKFYETVEKLTSSLILDANLDTNPKFVLKVGEKPSKDRQFIFKYQLFEYANKKLFKENEFVLEAVKLDGLSLEYADDFQSDPTVVALAVNQNGMALEYANEMFRTGKMEGKSENELKIILDAVKSNPQALNLLNTDFKTNRDFILECIKANGEVFKFADDKLKKDRFLATLEAVSRNGMMLKYAENFKNDREIALSAVKQDGMALKYVDKSLLSEEIILEALRQDKEAERCLSEEMKAKFKYISSIERFRIYDKFNFV